MPDKFEFQVGDLVSFGGLEGVVTNIDTSGPEPLEVEFKRSYVIYFTLDGRFDEDHTIPLLKLIERPKPKEEKPRLKAWLYRIIRPGFENPWALEYRETRPPANPSFECKRAEWLDQPEEAK